MPPAPMPAPPEGVLAPALGALKEALVEANLEARGPQRTPLRRLTQLEYRYTLADLLHIDVEHAAGLAEGLPAEADSGGFDTVAANQGISALHVRKYLDAADRALDLALDLGPPPESKTFKIEYAKSGYLNFMHDGDFLGSGVTMKVGDAVATFFDSASTYMFHTDTEGYSVPSAGRYKVTVEASPYQATSPVTLTLFRGKEGVAAAAALTDLIGSFDLVSDEMRTVEVATFLRPGDVVSPSVADLKTSAGGLRQLLRAGEQRARLRGRGHCHSLALGGRAAARRMAAQLVRLRCLGDLAIEDGSPVLTKEPYEHILRHRRRLRGAGVPTAAIAGGSASLRQLGAAICSKKGESFVNALRVPLRAILSSPSFLFHAGSEGTLDDFALATRLSYFLWRSMPDDELFRVAGGAAACPIPP